MKRRRICFYGGPGTGKSTIAPDLCGAMKKRSWSVEEAREVIKLRAYKGDFPKGFEQLHIFANQLHEEEKWLLAGVEYTISDSPVLMNASYSKLYGFEGWEDIVRLSEKFEKAYPAFNFYLPRRFDYQQEGRYQTEEQAKEVDEMIKEKMHAHLPADSLYFNVFELEDILKIIEENRNE